MRASTDLAHRLAQGEQHICFSVQQNVSFPQNNNPNELKGGAYKSQIMKI